jgi:hypothetical protein
MRVHLRGRATKLSAEILAAQRVAAAPGNSFVAASSEMSRIAIVAASRSCSDGVRNATHAIITTGC